MSPDDICRKYALRNVGLTVRMLDDEADAPDPTVLLEGPAEALEMLAELLMAVAKDQTNDGFGISPTSAGRAHFSTSATLGLHVHRLERRDSTR